MKNFEIPSILPLFKLSFFLIFFFINTDIELNAQSNNSYILYWSANQVRLESSNNYHATLQVKAQDIAKFIFHAPFLWDGTKMIKFSYQLESIAFQTENIDDYKKQVKVFEESFSNKLEEGENIQMRNISLTENIFGSIDIQILKEKNAIETEKRNRPLESRVLRGEVENPNANHVKLDKGVIAYRWGQHIGYGGKYSPFMKVSQFWESISEMPELIRTSDFQYEKAKAGITVQLADMDGVTYEFPLNGAASYHVFLEHIKEQKRLFKPNTLIYCTFNTDDDYETNLATHRIELIADDDPRFALNEKELTHFTFSWGKINIKKKGVYLKKIKKTDGTTISADPFENVTHIIKGLEEFAHLPIELLVADKKIKHFTCKISNIFDDPKPLIYDSDKGMTTDFKYSIDTLLNENRLIVIFDIHSQEFDFQPFGFRFLVGEPKNEVEKTVKDYIFIGQPLLSADGKTVHIDYEVKVASKGNLKIVDNEGHELWVKSGDFGVGKFSAVAENLKFEKDKQYKVVFALAFGFVEREIEF